MSEDDILSFLSGRLTGPALERVDAHAGACRICRLTISALAMQSNATHPRRRGRGDLSAFGPGDTLAGRYQIRGLLGMGGMGEVYEAFDTVLGETIALKTLAIGATPFDDESVARLKAEVQVARRVTHRNVCRVFDVGFQREADEGVDRASAGTAVPFFTMELLRGETLRQRLLRAGALPAGAALGLVEQIAAGVDAAHDAGVIHGDLKSDNIMLVPSSAEARAVITDFGLARPLDARARLRVGGSSSGPVAHRSGRTLAGTVGYMAPEQHEGRPAERAADIYALGVILYEMLTARLPIGPHTIARAVSRGQPIPARDLTRAREIPAGWTGALARALATAPSERFGRATELVAALRGPATTPRSAWTRPALAAGVVALLGATVVALATGDRRAHRTPARTARATATTATMTAATTATAQAAPAPAPVPPSSIARDDENDGIAKRDGLAAPDRPVTGDRRPRPSARRPGAVALPSNAPAARVRTTSSGAGAAGGGAPSTAGCVDCEEPGRDDLIDPFGVR